MSTHFSLKVIRLEDLRWKRPLYRRNPKFFIELSFGNVTKRTRTAKRSRSPTWNEVITFPASYESGTLEIQVIHESTLLPDSCIGVSAVKLADLFARSSVEVPLDIVSPKRGAEFMGRIFLRLSYMYAMEAVGLNIREAARDVQCPGIVKSADASKVVQPVDDGATQTESHDELYKAVGELLQRLEVFGKVIDALSELHPFVKIVWSLTSALYKAVKNVFEADKKVIDLVRTMGEAFEFVCDVQALGKRAIGLQRSIDGLLKQTIECCIFVREYTNHGFVGRMCQTDKSQKIERFQRTLAKLKNDIDSGVNIHTAVVSMRIAHGIDQLLLQQHLNPGHFDAFNRPVCLPGTRSEIRQQIIEWMFTETTQNVLWLYGVAGSGKSTISSTIAQHFRDMLRLGAFLFFERGKSEPSSVIRTIAYKLGIFDSSIGSSILSAIENDQDVATASSMHQFNKLLLQPLVASASSMSGPIVIVLDALDECGTPDSRRGLMGLLREFSRLPSIFRFLITSRRESDIDKILSSQPDHVRAMELDYTSKDSQEDVLIYLRTEMHRAVREEMEIPKGYPWEANIELLGRAAGGLFIWASTAVKMVEDSNTRLDRLEHLVSDSRSLSGFGLDALYAAVLSVSGIKWSDEGSKELFRKVLALVLLSKDPVSIGDIDGILGLPAQRSSILILQNLRSVLTYNPGGPVRLFHTSFSDYLMSRERSKDLWFIDISKAKGLIVDRCFVVMKDLLRFNICNLESSFVRNDDVPDLVDRIKSQIPSHLEYACLHWVQHLLDAPYHCDLLEKLSEFAHCHLLFWFEVLSLVKAFSRVAIRALLGVSSWAEPHDASLASFLRDASQLASLFAFPIMLSVPHIYVSMLPIADEDSEVAAHYSKFMTSMVRVERKGTRRPPLCLKVFEDHDAMSNSADFSPNGRHVVSASGDNTVIVWDIDSGEVIGEPLEGTTACFSPDGSCIMSGSSNGTVSVWDARNGKMILSTLKGHTDAVSSVAWSPDGRRMASGSWDKSIIIWDAADGRAIFKLTGHTKVVTSVAFSPVSARLASASYDNTIGIWDVNNGVLAYGPFEGHSDLVQSVAYSPDGMYVASGSDDSTIKIWEVESGNAVSTFKDHKYAVMSVTYSPCGSYIASGSWDGTITIWDSKSGKITSGPFEGHTEWINSVSYSPDGNSIVSASGDRTVRIWDVKAMAVSSESPPRHTDRITSVRFSPDGNRIASASWDRSIIIWDAETGKVVSGPLLGHTEAVTGVDFLPDGVLVSSSMDKTIRTWQGDSGKVVCGPLEGELTSNSYMALSPDGTMLVFGPFDNEMRIWDIAIDKYVARPSLVHSSSIMSVAFSPTGRQFASCSESTIKIWNTGTWEAMSELSIGQLGTILSIGFSPNDMQIACGILHDGTIIVLDAENGHISADHFEGHSGTVASILFSHSGEYLISGSEDNTIRVWLAENGQTVHDLDSHTGPIQTVALSPDDSRIVSGSSDNTVRLWDVSDLLYPIADTGEDATTSSFTDEDFSDWYLGDYGWIYGGPDSEYLLLWIPPDLRRTLYGPRNVFVFSCEFSTKLDFTRACLGKQWADCFISSEQES